jgi:UDP-2,3-diacylglucosamine pyrophosphatase LpxH
MFARRSQTNRYQRQIEAAVDRSRDFVLGGDIFDFRWTTLKCMNRTIDAALAYLEKLHSRNSECSIHYVLGNHDFHPEFIERLNLLAMQSPRLFVHPYYFQIESTLFLHGDVADRRINHDQLVLRRSDWKHERPAALPRHYLYDFAMTLRLHKLVNHVVHHPGLVVRRIEHYLNSLSLPSISSVNRIVFGHTHRAVRGYVYRGVEYYNGGAPMLGLKFEILDLPYHAEKTRRT